MQVFEEDVESSDEDFKLNEQILETERDIPFEEEEQSRKRQKFKTIS